MPILEAAAELVGPGLLDMIPDDGYSTKELHEKLDGTKYRSIATFADWLNSETDCMVLNATYHDYGPEQWGREIVETLTAEWPMVVEIQNEITQASAWLEENLRKNFQDLLWYLTDNKAQIVPKEQIPFPLDENELVAERR